MNLYWCFTRHIIVWIDSCCFLDMNVIHIRSRIKTVTKHSDRGEHQPYYPNQI